MHITLDYMELIDAALRKLGCTPQELAERAGLSTLQVNAILSRDSILTREQAFYVAMALEMSPLESEKLALLSVYANAKRPEFQRHILEKLARISKLDDGFNWTSYIESTLKPRILAPRSQNN